MTGPDARVTPDGLLGVLMLQTSFERIRGDIGNPDSFDFPVVHRTVRGASVERVVGVQDAGLVDLFVAEAQVLVDAGVTAITTSCGFMARHQRAVADRLPVPFVASALSLLERARRRHGETAVITADWSRLGDEHFLAYGATRPAVVAGMDGCPEFRAAIVEQTRPLRPDLVRAEVVAVAQNLRASHPHLGAILLECTNLPPYREAIEQATGLPVLDALTLCETLMSSSRGVGDLAL